VHGEDMNQTRKNSEIGLYALKGMQVIEKKYTHLET